jgi:hypothetical protein
VSAVVLPLLQRAARMQSTYSFWGLDVFTWAAIVNAATVVILVRPPNPRRKWRWPKTWRGQPQSQHEVWWIPKTRAG